MVQHEVFVIESVPNIASARGGHLLASIYSAAADVNYVPQLLMFDPQRTGGAQSRCRAYIVLVRSDVHKSRGPFAPTSTYRNTAPPATLRSILDPVSKVLPDATEEAQWQPAGIKHKADYRAPKLSHVVMTDGHRTMSSYDIDGPSPALSSDPVYLFDKRPGIKKKSSSLSRRAPPHPRLASLRCGWSQSRRCSCIHRPRHGAHEHAHHWHRHRRVPR